MKEETHQFVIKNDDVKWNFNLHSRIDMDKRRFYFGFYSEV